MRPLARWPHTSSGLGDAAGKRPDALGEIRPAELDEDGLIQFAILPLRDVVLFPNIVTPLFISDESTLVALEESTKAGLTMVAVAMTNASAEIPAPQDLYRVGTEVAIGRTMQIPDGSTSVLPRCLRRMEIVDFVDGGPYLRARCRPIEEPLDDSKETLALMRVVLTLFERCVRLNRSLPEEAYIYAVNVEEPGWLADMIASAIGLSIAERQGILETVDPGDRLQQISVLLGRELDVLELEDQIHSQVQSVVDRSQREVYLREQMRAIQSELSESDMWTQELNELRERTQALSLPEEVEARALREVKRLGQVPPVSPEVGIVRTYLDWLHELPWSEATEDNLNVRHAARVLNRDHYGLRKAKERILEYIAVRSLANEKQRQPILCFVGPPGTGKTSLGRSIAEALGRKFVRISLGGVHDEAEIRGHRRTYIGALPGRILQTMRRAGTVNPLFMLDELDKLGADVRGDPAAALLEVLDPEQNHAFSDHYLELPYDLSRVMFITTANTTDRIPPALLDRIEVIDFTGYIEEEKLVIARKFLVPRQMERNGLGKKEVAISEDALVAIIRQYTWEAGVRNLEREIGKTLRKIARRKAEGRKLPERIIPSMLGRLLGPPQISARKAEREDQVGAATVLAWTENGGDVMPVEVLLVDGKAGLQITGHVGDVMQESAQAAVSYIKSRAKDLGVPAKTFENSDIHIHIPEGAIPKDGPSAGITMAAALASALTARPVRRDVGMSGEITLRGRVLPVGGVREKVIAAYRIKLNTVILPYENKKDLAEVSSKVRKSLDLQLVQHMDEVLNIALRPSKRKPARASAKGSKASA
ncbi:MAG: endopeptidase La [Anaerolineales bacterium]